MTAPAADPPTTGPVLQELDRVRAELDALQDQLVESQRLAAIGTVAAGVAHEFNNLLTPVVAHSQLALAALDAGRPDEDATRRALARAHDNATRAGRICSAMLNLARGTGGHERVELRPIVDEAFALLGRDLAKDGITLQIDVPDRLAVRGDPAQLEQLLLNLLINARHALARHGGGRLGIVALADESAGGRPVIAVRVADTGPGIDPRHLPRIFEPFFTTKAGVRGEPRGTGLGLSICRQIAQKHGGTLAAASTPGVGTTLTLTLPAA